jgi:RNA ligase (TIGR02306 family)
MERKLASIREISEISPIPGADSIDVAKIDGWNTVVKKNQFKIGDRVIYCEVDSVLPNRPEFDFLGEKKRIRTKKLRGCLSQGICFPLDILPGADGFVLGTDVTELMGVLKYEPPIPTQLRGRVRCAMNRLAIPKTDEMRCQNIPGVLERHKGERFAVSEKIDGASESVYLDPETGMHVCSRNVDLAPDTQHKWNGDLYWRAAVEYNLEEILKQLGGSIALQGELFGANVQGGKYKLKDLQYRIFNFWDMVNHQYVERDVMLDTVEAFGLGKDFLVPQLMDIVLDHTVDDLLKLADGNSKINPDVLREGIVLRSIPESTDFELGRLSFKAVSNQFLLKFGE